MVSVATCEWPTFLLNERYGTWAEARRYSGLMLAARITLPHFSVSSAMNLPKSAGVIGIGRPPRSASRAFIVGSARAAGVSPFRLSTVGAWCILGHADAMPRACLVARHKITHGRDVGQRRRARFRGYRQRAHLASPGVSDGCRHDVETDLHLAGE